MKFRYAFLLPAALVVGSPVSTDNDRVIVRENGPLTSRDAPVALPRKIGAKESNELVSREANGRHGHGDFDLGDHKYGQVAQYIYGLTGKISIWNEFGAVDDIQTCSVFKSLEWLAYSLIEPTRDIASHVSEDGQTKSVPFDIVIRGTQMWTKILDSLKLQLWATQSYSWSLDTQIHIAECYVNYASQAAAWLEILQEQLDCIDDHKHKKDQCMAYESIDSLYLAYKLVAAVIYSEEIVTGYFPEHIPTWWRSRCHGPKPCTSIRDYIRFNDIVIIEEEVLFFKPEHLRHICSNGTDHDGGHHDGGHHGGHDGGHDGGHEGGTCDKHEHHGGHGGHGGHSGDNGNNGGSDGNHGEHGDTQGEGRGGNQGEHGGSQGRSGNQRGGRSANQGGGRGHDQGQAT